ARRPRDPRLRPQPRLRLGDRAAALAAADRGRGRVPRRQPQLLRARDRPRRPRRGQAAVVARAGAAGALGQGRGPALGARLRAVGAGAVARGPRLGRAARRPRARRMTRPRPGRAARRPRRPTMESEALPRSRPGSERPGRGPLAGRRILYASTNHAWAFGWTFYQMLAEALAGRNEVVYVDTPTSLARLRPRRWGALLVAAAEREGRLDLLRAAGLPLQRSRWQRSAGGRIAARGRPLGRARGVRPRPRLDVQPLGAPARPALRGGDLGLLDRRPPALRPRRASA